LALLLNSLFASVLEFLRCAGAGIHIPLDNWFGRLDPAFEIPNSFHNSTHSFRYFAAWMLGKRCLDARFDPFARYHTSLFLLLGCFEQWSFVLASG
jgi:hypothetical protein